MCNASRIHRIALAMCVTIVLLFAVRALGYDKAMTITFTGCTGTEVLTNFPTLIVLSNGTVGIFDYSQLQSPPYYDLRFFDEVGTELNYEIDSWDPSGKSYVWVKVPLLANGVSITCCWSQAGLTDPPAHSIDGSTWSEGYMSVHHLGTNTYVELREAMGDPADLWALDSAADWGNGTYGMWGYTYKEGGGSMEITDWIPGKIGECLSFNEDDGEAQDEYVWLEDGYDSFPDGMTVAFWAREKTVDGTNYRPFLEIDDYGEYMIAYDGQMWSDLYTWQGEYYGAGPDCAANVWMYHVYTLTKSGDLTWYMNGGVKWSATGLTFPSDHLRQGNWFAVSGWSEYLPGRLDEIRVSGVARSADWVATSYMNQNNPGAFATYKLYTVPGIPVITNVQPRDVKDRKVTAVGILLAGGPTTVKIYYGPSDGGTNVLAWAQSADLGIQEGGEVPFTITNLVPNWTYYYRYHAANAYGSRWAATTVQYMTAPVFNMGYAHAMQIAFSGYSGTETLENFPALIVFSNGLANGDFYYSQILSPPHADLRFADTTGTELNYEVDTWDPTGVSYVWVQVPQLQNGTIVTCFWSKAGASDPSYTTDGSTWSAGYLSVHHLSATNGTTALDSAAKGYDGTLAGTEETDWVPGRIGPALLLNEDDWGDESVILPAGYSSFPSGVTVAAWVNISGVITWGYMPFFQIGIGDVANYTYVLWMGPDSYLDEVWLGDTSSYWYMYSASDTYVAGEWVYVVFTCEQGSPGSCLGTLYKDGEATDTDSGFTAPPDKLRTSNFIGYDTEAYYLNGTIDELQVSDTARSPDWVKACYDNQVNPSTFATYTPAVVPEPVAVGAAAVVGCWLLVARKKR